MAFVKQDYELGLNTTLSTLNQLTAATEGYSYYENLSWPGRTLSCFIDDEGHFIEPNGTAVFNRQTAQVSGIWTLNKTSKPVKIYAIGNTGQIDVRITENTTIWPLANNEHPYTSSYKFTMNSGDVSSIEIYTQDTSKDNENVGEGSLIVEISGVAGTTIKSIKVQGSDVPGRTDSSINVVSCCGWDYGDGTNPLYVNNHQQEWISEAWSGISVDFVQGGVLTYIPNKTYVNQ